MRLFNGLRASVRGGVSGAQTVALADANRYCAEQGKEIVVTNTAGGSMNGFGAGQSNITFRCLQQEYNFWDVTGHAPGKGGWVRDHEQFARDVIARLSKRFESDPLKGPMEKLSIGFTNS